MGKKRMTRKAEMLVTSCGEKNRCNLETEIQGRTALKTKEGRTEVGGRRY